MRKLLIFATIVLVFAFATQKKVHNHTKDFNPSKLFNLTKLCKHGYFFSNKTKKCEKKKKYHHEHFRPFNRTNCTKGFKHSCKKSKISNKTWCSCKTKYEKYGRHLRKLLVDDCKTGYIYYCEQIGSGKNYKLSCGCKKMQDDVVDFTTTTTYKCPVNYFIECINYPSGKSRCNCKNKKKFPRYNMNNSD